MSDDVSSLKTLLLLCTVLVLFTGTVRSQQKDLAFETIPLDQGASTHVSCILQDRTGFIWIATWSGLYMYDGYGFVSYKHGPEGTSSIAENGLSTVYEDKAGVLWVGSWIGLERFDRSTGGFKHFTPNPLAPGGDPGNSVCALREDKEGTLWVGTWAGLYRFDRASETFSLLRHDSTDPGSVAHNSIQAIYEDKGGTLWLGTAAGLDRYDAASKRFLHCTSVPPESRTYAVNRFAEYSVLAILEDGAGMIWLGTTRGLTKYDPASGLSSEYPYISPHTGGLQYIRTGLNAVCWDPASPSLLIATADGLFTFSRQSGLFERRAETPVTSLCAERSGSLLLGTDTGLLKLNMARQPFRKYPMGDIGCGPTFGRVGTLWIMGYKQGYHKFDTRAKRFVPYSFGTDILCFVHLPEKGGSLAFFKRDGSFYIRDSLGRQTFALDRSASIAGLASKEYTKSLSFATQARRGYYIGSHAGWLYLFEPGTNAVLPVFNLNQSICWIQEDSAGHVWVGTLGGKLVRYDPEREAVTEYRSDPGNPSGWNGKPINWFHEGRSKDIWFATSLGLLGYDRKTDSFVRYTTANGLADDNVRGVAEDTRGFVWVSTTKGVSRIDPATGRIKNYDASYGLDPAANIYFGGMLRDANGEMYFGGTNGITCFHPDSIRDNPFIPPVVITSLKKFNDPCLLSKEVRLPYDENFISFEFVALSYVSPEKNQYAYMMEGVDRDWVSSGARRYASYPNLSPGSYVFRVKGSNNEGIWNEAGASIAVLIRPPWWKSPWAYGFYALAVMAATYVTWRTQVRRLRIRHEVEMSKFEAAKLREVDELKSRFFANISHEFRTPLTLILGPVKRMREASTDRQMRDDLGVVHRNATRLLGLVNQLLDLSRLESGAMKLQAASENIVPLLKGLQQSFCSYAERKRISMGFTSSAEDIPVYVDREKVEKIVTNLLSNAFKFTPEGGRVELSVSEDSEYVSVCVSDTGIGIPEGQLPRIFDRFYQVDGSHTREQEGTGIGLSLTRELVELHKGTITVESEEGRGSTFTVRLPLGKAHLVAEEIREPREGERGWTDRADAIRAVLSEQEEMRPVEVQGHLLRQSAKPILLIVEDNADVRQYIRRDLDQTYNILEAVDGADGWNKSLEEMPDIIVSDVMMPKLDGFALCAKLKADGRTSHIPVILLTAKAASQDKIEGFEMGADDYIMKPFEPEELKARLGNLIEQRKRIHEHFRRHGLFEIDEKKITPSDQKFVHNVVAKINERMSDPAFGVELLAEEMAVSRSLLLKKIESLIGEHPSELIKRSRLNKAATLIEGRFGNVTEVAYEVGFSNPAYFAECFKRQFGIPPSHYHRSSAKQ